MERISIFKRIFPDIRPLRDFPNYRRVFLGQWISTLGSSITMVALGYQVYEMTNSSFWVGVLGVSRLIPMTLAGVLSAPIADRVDRRRYLIIVDILLAVCSFGLCLATVFHLNYRWIIFIAMSSAWLEGMHRPAFEALIPRLVPKELLSAVAAWNGFRGTFSTLVGPACAGLILAKLGLSFSYLIDGFSFLGAIYFLTRIQGSFKAQGGAAGKFQWHEWLEGARYAIRSPVLMGTYLVDMAAMVFTYPHALFPEIAKRGIYGVAGESVLGFLHSSVGLGALIATLFSGWASKFSYHGRAIVFGAIGWSIAIYGMGRTSSLSPALVYLAMGGGLDMVSALFRSTIWNETIPDHVRSRLAAIEMASYMSGPLVGGTLLGLAAETLGVRLTLEYGALLSIASIIGITFCLKPFWNYQSKTAG